WVLAPPVLGLAWLGRGRGAPDGYAGPRLAALATGFLPVAAFCYAPSFVRLGPQRFARQALLLGAGFAGTYAVAYPWPAALGGAVGLAAFVLADRAPRSVLAAGAVATLGLAVLTGARSAPSLAAAPRLAAEVSTLALRRPLRADRRHPRAARDRRARGGPCGLDAPPDRARGGGATAGPRCRRRCGPAQHGPSRPRLHLPGVCDRAVLRGAAAGRTARLLLPGASGPCRGGGALPASGGGPTASRGPLQRAGKR